MNVLGGMKDGCKFGGLCTKISAQIIGMLVALKVQSFS